jgi:hypothetical protein
VTKRDKIMCLKERREREIEERKEKRKRERERREREERERERKVRREMYHSKITKCEILKF